MPKKKFPILTIDLNKWQTQADYAKEHGIKLGTVSAQVARSKTGATPAPIEYLDVPELGITLIRRV
jgi:hypothetical protein